MGKRVERGWQDTHPCSTWPVDIRKREEEMDSTGRCSTWFIVRMFNFFHGLEWIFAASDVYKQIYFPDWLTLGQSVRASGFGPSSTSSTESRDPESNGIDAGDMKTDNGSGSKRSLQYGRFVVTDLFWKDYMLFCLRYSCIALIFSQNARRFLLTEDIKTRLEAKNCYHWSLAVHCFINRLYRAFNSHCLVYTCYIYLEREYLQAGVSNDNRSMVIKIPYKILP